MLEKASKYGKTKAMRENASAIIRERRNPITHFPWTLFLSSLMKTKKNNANKSSPTVDDKTEKKIELIY